MDGFSGFTLDGGNAGGADSEPVNDSGGAIAAAFLSLGGSDSGDGSGDTERFDAAIHVSPDKRNADGSYRRKRGRKPGAGNRSSRTANNSVGIDALTRALAIFHVGLAAATKSPEWALEESEAQSLAMASANVMEQFDIRPDPKIEAIFGLITTASVIYGPRVYMIRARKKEEREKD